MSVAKNQDLDIRKTAHELKGAKMNKILVSLVSDQIIPNLLAIHHFQPVELLFITTDAMEKKDKFRATMETLCMLGLDYPENRVQKLVVKEDSILDCHRKIEEWMAGREDGEFIVNFTCGTKIMSIAVYEFFKDYGSRMIYIPIPKNEYIMPFPKKAHAHPEPLPLRLSVPQYLTACGLKVTNGLKLQEYKNEAKTRKGIAEFVVSNYEPLKPLLGFFGDRLRRYRDDKEYDFSIGFDEATPAELEFFNLMRMSYDGNTLSKILSRSETGFLTGGWLEEFCFNETMKIADIDDAVIGLKLMNKKGGDNEFDVMFTKDNTLYFIECKSLDQNDDKKADALYKIGALQKEFGLRVESFMVTTSPHVLKDGRLRPALRARAEQFNTTVVLQDEVSKLAEKLLERMNRKHA
jgi:hypothetical protein